MTYATAQASGSRPWLRHDLWTRWSATVWRKYLPHAEIRFVEFDAYCVALHKPQLDALSVEAVTGDQADVETLQGWVKETQGG